MVSSPKSQQCPCSAGLQRYFHNFIKLFLCFTNCPPSMLVNSFAKVQACSLPTCLCARKVAPSPAPRGVFCKRGLLKKFARLLYYFLRNFFNHYFFFLSFMNFGPSTICQGSPDAFRMHESLVIGCRGYSSQTVGLNFASEVTQRRVTFDLPGGLPPR